MATEQPAFPFPGALLQAQGMWESHSHRDVGIPFKSAPHTPRACSHVPVQASSCTQQTHHRHIPATCTHTRVCLSRRTQEMLSPSSRRTQSLIFTWRTRKSHIFQAINITTETSSYRRNYSRSQSGTTKTSTTAKITRRSRRAALAALSPRNAR